MHHPSVVEYHQVSLDPAVGVYVLRGINLLLEPIDDPANLFDIIDNGQFARHWIFCGKLEHAAAVYLQEWTIGV